MELVENNNISNDDLLNIIYKMSFDKIDGYIYLDDFEKNNKIIKKFLSNEFIINSNIIIRILETYGQKPSGILNFKRNKFINYNYSTIIATLLKLGANPNVVDINGNNFLQLIVKLNFPINIIEDLVYYAREYGIDINHTNNNGESFLHTFFYSGNYIDKSYVKDNIIEKFFNTKNFDKEIEDNNKVKIIDAMEHYNSLSNSKGKYSNSDIYYIKDLYYKENKMYNNNTKEIFNFNDEMNIPKIYGEILTINQTNVNYNLDDYINELILHLASSKKNTLIECSNLFESNLLISELIYRINNNLVPNFLKDNIILKTNINYLMFQYSNYKELKKQVTKYIGEIIDKNVILLIDNIDILNDKNTPNTNNILSVLEPLIKNGKIKVIGITTKKNTLNDDYNIIKFNTNNYEVLYMIVKDMYMYYATANNIFLEKNEVEYFIKLLLTLEDNPILDTNEISVNLNNVELIIDYIFCLAKIHNQDKLSLNDIQKNINNYQIKVKSLTKNKI